MDWKELLQQLNSSISYQLFPQFFRDEIAARLPTCSPDQLQQLRQIIDLDQENIHTFMEESKQFQSNLQKKILGLEEIIDNQQTLNDADAKINSLL